MLEEEAYDKDLAPATLPLKQNEGRGSENSDFSSWALLTCEHPDLWQEQGQRQGA